MRNVLVFGATSALAEAAARRFAAEGARLYLVARDSARLDAVAADLRVRGAEVVETKALDARETESHTELVNRCFEVLGELDAVLVAHGVLPDQRACERSFEPAGDTYETNLLSAVSLLTHLANRFEAQRRGTIAVISSVAGDRGRRSNYVYGSAKAGLSAFLQGLRARLHAAQVRVVTIKPGPVVTPMTAHLRPGLLWSTPERVGRGIHRAMRRGRSVVYLPWYWRPVMMVIRLLPESLFKRLPL